MEGELDALVAEAKAKIGELIAKPKMTEKLLSKPPFRFLHDIISALTGTTGFAEGLYSGEELDSASITDKNAKIVYLEKIFTLVGICMGAPLEVKALKVVQGLEPELTNQFLVALAASASNESIDNEEAVRRTLRGEQPGQNPPPYKRGGGGPPPPAEAKGGDSGGAGAKGYGDDRRPPADSKDMPAPAETFASERGKSRGGTRGGKPQQATADVGLSGFSNTMMPNLDAEIERCDGSEATTQRMLGELISRPKLTEKLLSKPPFRFLHDIVMEVIRATGFASGLYNDLESDSANVNEKNQKIDFLEKIIKVVGMQLSTIVDAKPPRIVAGLDAQLTNTFLQLLALAAKNVPDSRRTVQTILEQMGDGSGGRGAEAKTSPAPEPTPAVSQPPSRPAPVTSAPVVVERAPPPTSSMSLAPPSEQKEVFSSTLRPDDRREMLMADEKGGEAVEGEGEAKRSTRPTTARRRPPKIKDTASELQSKDIAPVAKRAEGIIVDGAADEDDAGIMEEGGSRLADDFRSESKAGDRNAAPAQSKLVQDIMSRQAEQESALRGGRAEVVDETKAAEAAGVAPGGGGIRLMRMKKTGSEKKLVGSGGIGSNAGGAAGSPSAPISLGEGDLEKMRASIQSLVQQTGPMGVCMDFIQEDISLMTAELHKWEEESTRYEALYEEAKRKTKEAMHPLKLELADLEDQIADCIAKISSAKAANAKNDDKIQQMLKLIATA